MGALLGLGGVPISLLICGLATLMTWVLTGASGLRSREEERNDDLASALTRSRHPKHTDIKTVCPGCGRESHRVVDYRSDLGAVSLVEKHCGPCAHPRAKRTINFDTMTTADIRRALDPESQEIHP